MREYAASVSGAGAVECIPDEFVRSGEVVLVDVPPEVVRRRILSGRVYDTQRVGGALAHYFRTANLEALGELARAWMADNVQEVGDEILLCSGFADSEARPLVLAGVSGSDWGEVVLRRAADVAAEEDADLHVAHVTLADGVAHRVGPMLDRYRQETAQMGGIYIEVEGRDPAHGLAATAEARGASWVVVARHRSRLGELAGPSRHVCIGCSDTRIDIVRRDG